MAELKHIMMDLETRGTVPGCAGISIGCVEMDFVKLELGREFYTVVSLPDSLEHFLEEDPDTVEWWEKLKAKSPEAGKLLEECNHPDAPGLVAAMESLNDWLKDIGAGVRSTRLYGNGADFDNPILRVMYQAAKVQPFGSKAGFFGGRCYRTLKSLDELFGPAFAAPKLERTGVYHHALDDAKTQALHLMDIVRKVRAQ